MKSTVLRTGDRGIALVEFALVLPILLVMLFSVVDLGRLVLTRQILTNISREAANLASRGTSLDDAIEAVQGSAAPLDLDADGYVILTQVFRSSPGVVVILSRSADGGIARSSRVGNAVGGPATLPATSEPVPPVGQTLMVAEVFYVSEPITPLSELLDATFDNTFYDVAYF